MAAMIGLADIANKCVDAAAASTVRHVTCHRLSLAVGCHQLATGAAGLAPQLEGCEDLRIDGAPPASRQQRDFGQPAEDCTTARTVHWHTAAVQRLGAGSDDFMRAV
jgi:hypothetical protein